MNYDLVTLSDLQNLKRDLLIEIKQLLNENAGIITKQWLKSNEVRKILNISTGTLQNLRLNNTLPYTKIGGVIYYNAEDIKAMMDKHNTSYSKR